MKNLPLYLIVSCLMGTGCSFRVDPDGTQTFWLDAYAAKQIIEIIAEK